MRTLLHDYEAGVAETIKNDLIYVIVKTFDDPNCKRAVRRACIASCDIKPVVDYLKEYFTIYDYKMDYEKIDTCEFTTIVDIVVTKTEKSHLPPRLIKAYKKIVDIPLKTADIPPLGEGSKEENEEEPFNSPHLMSADEARDIADKKNLENQFSLDHYLLLIGEAIGKAAKEGKYSVDFNLEYNTDTEVINKLSSYLESLGFTVNEDTTWNSSDGYYKKLTIKFYSK